MTYEEYEILVADYMKQHPNSETPHNWEFVLWYQTIGEFILESKGRLIMFVLPKDKKTDDGGSLEYVEN